MVIDFSICVDLLCQSADAQRETASQTIELIKVLLAGTYCTCVFFPWN